MGKHPPPVTMREVAAHCGVSLATASKAFNPRSEDIGTATRERILAAAQELGFHPDRSTSLRARKRWQNIGLAWGRHAPRGDGIYAELCETIALTAKPWGYHLLFTPIEDVRDWRLMQRAQRLDGVIVVESMPDGVLAEIEATSYPAVLINLVSPRPLHAAIPGDRAGARLLVEHLAAAGHRSIAYLPRRAWGTHASEDERWAGTQEGAAACGVRLERCAPQDIPGRCRARGISAAIAYSQLELGLLLTAAREADLAIPKRLSVASCSDVPWLAHLHPPVTALEVPVPAMAQYATSLLIDLIERAEAPAPQQRSFPLALVQRASVAPPP